MEDSKPNYNKINQALRQDLSNLWDECFGDIPIFTQRLLKSYGMRYHKEAYKHGIKRKMSDMKIWANLKVNLDENHFSPDLPQTKAAQALCDEVVQEFMKGTSSAARLLRSVLKDKKIKVSVHKSLGYDASMDGYNPATKEIYIDFCAGVFSAEKNESIGVCRDGFAQSLGHELGHFVEQMHRSLKCEPNTILSKSWEIESFCDAFGARLATEAGYSLQPVIRQYKEYSEKGWEPQQPNPHPPLENRMEWLKLGEKAFKATGRKSVPFDKNITSVEWNAQKIENEVWANLKNLVAEKKARGC